MQGFRPQFRQALDSRGALLVNNGAWLSPERLLLVDEVDMQQNLRNKPHPQEETLNVSLANSHRLNLVGPNNRANDSEISNENVDHLCNFDAAEMTENKVIHHSLGREMNAKRSDQLVYQRGAPTWN